MPELPEVETTVRYLIRELIGEVIKDVWTDWKEAIKKPSSFSVFRKDIKGKKILNIQRKGKNIVFDLSGNNALLIHQKMTGHLLVGKWKYVPLEKRKPKKERGTDGAWIAEGDNTPLNNPVNDYIRFMVWFKSGKMMGFSDLRKFGKIILAKKPALKKMADWADIGPDALDLNLEGFIKRLQSKNGKIKQVLMDQKVIAGIGNIYSDEILFVAKIHPLSRVNKLAEKDLKDIYKAVRLILTKAINLEGASIDDYRKPDGNPGRYALKRLVYQKEGEKCPNKCGGVIERLKIGGRSAHFCPKEARLEPAPRHGGGSSKIR